ncbi:Os08g0124533 [Oryza sativa Japonica Group]|uniref:Os08g0124533 protein n=1 Tax=Oryza sativa subsp. japonica TaxID=39947 RepID=A0A0P0XB51_ORYSJ|nr:hypothetical protein EE612_041872 [Oryza sativa]BAT03633.1 Os08g0124533 [Oryza sativa Japonica Group]
MLKEKRVVKLATSPVAASHSCTGGVYTIRPMVPPLDRLFPLPLVSSIHSAPASAALPWRVMFLLALLKLE